jgi:4-amino-4-deoxy-L-arabinose transferase-like glycosyltransferase
VLSYLLIAPQPDPDRHHSASTAAEKGRATPDQERPMSNDAKAPLVVFGVSALIVLSFWIVAPAGFHHVNSDYRDDYEPVARELLTGHGSVYADGTPATVYPPGYPLLLAAIFKLAGIVHVSEASLLSVFALIGMGTAAVFLFLVAQSVWGRPQAWVCALAWITYPFSLWLTKHPNSEVAFMMVFYGAFWLFWTSIIGRRPWPWYFLSGLLMGGAMLIRPIAIGAAGVLGASLWLSGQWMRPRARLVPIAVMMLGNMVAIVPWEGWVYAKTGRVIPLSTNGPAAILDGLTFGVSMPTFEFRRRELLNLSPDVLALMERIKARSGEAASVSDFAGLLKDELHTAPEAVAKLVVIKAARSWYAIESHRFETVALTIQSFYLLLIVWGSKTAWAQRGLARQLVITVWLMIGYFWAMNVVSSSILRYMVPGMGLLFTLLPAIWVSPRGTATS